MRVRPDAGLSSEKLGADLGLAASRRALLVGTGAESSSSSENLAHHRSDLLAQVALEVAMTVLQLPHQGRLSALIGTIERELGRVMASL